MKYNYLFILLASIAMACSAPAEQGSVEAKKKELDEAKKQASELNAKIVLLEKELAAADPSFVSNRNAILISTFIAERKDFEHFMEARGSVASRKNVYLSAQAGGEIIRVYVKEGQYVNKGQVLVSLNTEILRSSLAELENSYVLAKTIYEKQAKLWEQKIGTEVQYLQAKNNKESLEQKIATVKSQIDQMIVKAPFSGTVDRVDALEGQVTSPGAPLVRMVGNENMYVRADISEEFIGKIKSGDKVQIYFPNQDKKITAAVSSVSQVINPENRTFEIEIQLAVNFMVQPNQVVVLTLRDYLSKNTFAVPTKLILRDNSGQFIYTVEPKEGKQIARKLYITTGISYDGSTEVKEGIAGGEVIIGEGFRDVAEGVEVHLVQADSTKAVAIK
jgi:RND family efflux transporter MFP subunit